MNATTLGYLPKAEAKHFCPKKYPPASLFYEHWHDPPWVLELEYECENYTGTVEAHVVFCPFCGERLPIGTLTYEQAFPDEARAQAEREALARELAWQKIVLEQELRHW